MTKIKMTNSHEANLTEAVIEHRPRATTRRPTPSGGETKTQQNMKTQTNINVIVASYKKGIAPILNKKQPQYGDFSAAVDLHQAHQLVAEARKEFMELPSRIRDAAGNDPIQFLEMYADEGGRALLQNAGYPAPEEAQNASQTIPQTDTTVSVNTLDDKTSSV